MPFFSFIRLSLGLFCNFAEINLFEMGKTNKSFLRWNIPAFIISLCLIAVFWVPLNNAMATVFVNPLLMHVKNHSGLVQFVLIVLMAVCYFFVSKQMKRESWWSIRRILTFEVICVLIIFRFSGLYEFYGIGRGFPSYLDVVAILAVVVEIYAIFWNVLSNCNNTSTESEYTSFFIDQPTKKDELKRKSYAQVLVEKIVSTFSIKQFNDTENHDMGSFTVLLSERYGQGKSSFFEQIKGVCSDKNIEVIEFKPWLSNDSGQMIFNFFNLLREKLGFHDKELRKLLQSYAIVASDHITGKAAKASLNLFDSISIETQHDRISQILQEERKLRVVLIDDVDRLQTDELLALIKLIRNTADFPYIAYVVAADKSAVKETLRSASISDTEVYLKKFFNFELLFPADDDNVLGKLIDRIAEILKQFGYTSQNIKEIEDNINKHPQYYTPVFPNMRDVYRFCNILSFELDLLRSMKNAEGVNISMLKDVYIADLVKICMIQFVSLDLYKIFRDYRFVLLEDYRHGKLVLRDVCKKFVDTSERMQCVRETVKKAGNIMPEIDFEGNSQSGEDNFEGKEVDFKTLSELLINVSPDEEELLKFLIDDLWDKTDGYVDLRKVCYRNQYFLYFSGKYRRDELSDQEALNLYSSDGALFVQETEKKIANKKESMLHKLNSIVVRGMMEDRLLLFENILFMSQIDHKEYLKQNPMLPIGYYEFFQTQQYGEIIRKLYLPQGDETIDKDAFLTAHKELFRTTKEFASNALGIHWIECASLLEEGFSPIFTKEQAVCFSKILIDRFYNEVFIKNPFDEKAIETIPCMRLANEPYWNKLFVKYIQASDNPMEWMFRLFKLNGDGKGMSWNRQMVLAVCGEHPQLNTIMELAKGIVGDEIFQEYKENSNLIVPLSGEFDNIENIMNKQFTKAAYEWLTKQS